MPAPVPRRSGRRRAGALGLDAPAAGEVGKGGEGEPARSPPPLATPRARPGGVRGRPTGGWHCPLALSVGNTTVPAHAPGAAPHLAPGRATAGGQPAPAPRPAGSRPLPPRSLAHAAAAGADPAGTALKVSRSCCGVADMCSTVHGSIS